MNRETFYHTTPIEILIYGVKEYCTSWSTPDWEGDE